MSVKNHQIISMVGLRGCKIVSREMELQKILGIKISKILFLHLRVFLVLANSDYARLLSLVKAGFFN